VTYPGKYIILTIYVNQREYIQEKNMSLFRICDTFRNKVNKKKMTPLNMTYPGNNILLYPIYVNQRE